MKRLVLALSNYDQIIKEWTYISGFLLDQIYIYDNLLREL